MLEPGTNLVTENLPAIPLELSSRSKSTLNQSRCSPATGTRPKREILVAEAIRKRDAGPYAECTARGFETVTSFSRSLGGGTATQDRRLFLFFKATGGNEITQCTLRCSVGEVTRLTTDDKKRIGGGPWLRAGDRYVYSCRSTGGGTTRETIKTEFYTINRRIRHRQNCSRLSTARLERSCWSPDDTKLLVGKTFGE